MKPELRLGSLTTRAQLTGQHFTVILRGVQIAMIRPTMDIRTLRDPEVEVVDILALLAAGVAHGLFTADPLVLATARAERLHGGDPQAAAWRLILDGAAPGVLRLLVNMAEMLQFDTITIVLTGTETAPPTPIQALPYPDCHATQEFRFFYERPQKSRTERAVRLGFTEPPDDATLDRTIAALDIWGNLLMAGAYSDDWTPMASGVMAEQATLEDETTVGVSLPICFGAAESMFAPILNLARRLHRRIPLAFVEILRPSA